LCRPCGGGRNLPLRPSTFRRRPVATAMLKFKGIPHSWVLAERGDLPFDLE